MFNNLAASLMGLFCANDPTTPDLVFQNEIPQVGLLKYAVRGMTPAPKNQKDSRALNCHIAVGNCLNMMQKQTSTPVKKWSATHLLQVIPEAGSDLNAYYDRNSLKFFFHNFRGKTYYFADSSDIVTHELGHAFLDAMRPDFWSIQALEIWSFHEAFSDITSMFHLMSYDAAINKVLSETKGNLLLSNTISRIAEEVGILIRAVTKNSTYMPDALRNPAAERFLYVNPSSLPKNAPNNALAAECHSFGRVFSNAWYNIFVRIYNNNVAAGQTQMAAFKSARDFCYSTMMQAIPSSARVPNYYAAVAKSMVAVSKSKNPSNAEIIKSVFLEWKILVPSDLTGLSNVKYRDVVSSLKKDDVVFRNNKVSTICVKSNKEVFASELPIAGAMGLKENFKIEVASDSFYEFDSKGNLVDQVVPTDEEIKSAATQCVLMASENLGQDKMWNIENNKLIRQYIS
jgi:hypothetical protein